MGSISLIKTYPDDPKVPILLLPFATQVAITTCVCIAEYFSWDDFSTKERIALGQLYFPYLALGEFAFFIFLIGSARCSWFEVRFRSDFSSRI